MASRKPARPVSVGVAAPLEPIQRAAASWRGVKVSSMAGSSYRLHRQWSPGGYLYSAEVAVIERSAGMYVARALDADRLDNARGHGSKPRMAEFMADVCASLSFQEAIMETNLWLLQRGWLLAVYTDEQAAMSLMFWARRDEDLAITGSLSPCAVLSPWAKQ